MRILFARNLFYPQDFGGNRYPFEVCSRLLERGHELTVVTGNTGTVNPGFERRFSSLDLIRYRINRSRPQLTHFSNVAGSAWIFRSLRGRGFDAVVTSSYDTALAASVFDFGPGARRTFIYHSRLYHDLAEQATSGPLLRVLARWYINAVQKRVLTRQTRIVAVSDFSAMEIRSSAPAATSKIRVVSTGVDTRAFTPEGKQAAKSRLGIQDRPLLLSLGRLSPVKRIDVFLRAVALLRETGLDFVVLIAGTGPLEDELRGLAASLGLGNQVRFTGYLDQEGTRAVLNAADLVVSASAFENRSLAMLESFACGTPVMGTPGGGTPELLKLLDSRLVFEGMDSASIAEGLRRALDSGFPLEVLGVQARQLAEREFDWDVVVAQLERVFVESSSDSCSPTEPLTVGAA